MDELVKEAFGRYFLLQCLVIVIGISLAYLVLFQVKRIFSDVDKEMWGNHTPEHRHIKN